MVGPLFVPHYECMPTQVCRSSLTRAQSTLIILVAFRLRNVEAQGSDHVYWRMHSETVEGSLQNEAGIDGRTFIYNINTGKVHLYLPRR